MLRRVISFVGSLVESVESNLAEDDLVSNMCIEKRALVGDYNSKQAQAYIFMMGLRSLTYIITSATLIMHWNNESGFSV